MMEELRTERVQQQEQHFFLVKLIETSPTGILILDYDEHIYQLNPRAEQILGIREADVLKRPIKDVVNPIVQQVQLLHSGESTTFSNNGVDTYKIQKSHFIDRGFPRYFVMIEELTAEILAAEKKAYGKVIRMMAHEVNNTLGPVNSIIQSTLHTDEIWQTVHKPALKEALQVALNRNNNLNLFMRNFADVVRLPEPVRKNFDLHKLLNDVTNLMQLQAAGKQVIFEMDLARGELLLLADEQQMEQVLINIIKNAIEAIEGTGTVRFTTKQYPRTLIISDTGKGIPVEIAADIFSPFFSTKKDGQGIGLTLIREILLNHRFVFTLETSTPGRTDFNIHF